MSDETAFADFVRQRGAALYRYGYLLTGSHHDADDLVQEALIRLRGKWQRLHTDDPIGYVRTTMARLHVSFWRRRKNRERPAASLPEVAVDDPGLASVDAEATQADALWAALATLPPRQRAVLVLRFYEQLTDAEIAETLHLTRGTIRGHASRGLEKLRSSHAVHHLAGVLS
ncbi:SigE family RNA polymerase sigma factor [Catellatospora chokoriensis]|uniref:DNA-directed RNA polymerase sigma-70 factor n=1 Tax=Catellatospora chokoriensis TaxID=310353 RepID=A0A8J3NP00_9ACTN|nr:SigE family RNA polymerase sigma factor [Catellatospora chokoriensis]GIF87535.1 DNA-directed RNA polymerase sigma-70 factor [Catellatospora chokoriensis]